MNSGSDWRGPMRTFRVYRYIDGKFSRGDEVKAHQVSWPARGIHYFDMGGDWLLQGDSRGSSDGAEVVRLYAEIDGDWRVVFEAPEGTVSVRELERARREGGGSS